jgi:hypothetical protein
MNNWDASLQKAFAIGERFRADFRTEFYDFPNHLSYFNINTGSFAAIPPSTFGQVSSATDPRTLQFAPHLLSAFDNAPVSPAPGDTGRPRSLPPKVDFCL